VPIALAIVLAALVLCSPASAATVERQNLGP
jgi:hypothetical protein